MLLRRLFWADSTVEIKFDLQSGDLIVANVTTHCAQRLVAKGLIKTDLMGNPPSFDGISDYPTRWRPLPRIDDRLF